MIDIGRMNAIRQGAAYRRALRDFLDFIEIFSSTLQGTERMALNKLIMASHKRFSTSRS